MCRPGPVVGLHPQHLAVEVDLSATDERQEDRRYSRMYGQAGATIRQHILDDRLMRDPDAQREASPQATWAVMACPASARWYG